MIFFINRWHSFYLPWLKDEKSSAKSDKDGAESKEEKEKKEKEPEFEMLPNPSRVIKPQVWKTSFKEDLFLVLKLIFPIK